MEYRPGGAPIVIGIKKYGINPVLHCIIVLYGRSSDIANIIYI
jgi:hypothetical protein